MQVTRTRISAAVGAAVLVVASTMVTIVGVPAIASAADLSVARGQNVLMDTDFGGLNDDSQALYLLTQAGVDLLGSRR